jgi:Skp family chaperone for outer membrane proteins
MKYMMYAGVVLLATAFVVRADNELGMADLRVCLINTNDIMQESATGKKIIADLEKMRDALTREVKKSEDEFLRAVEALQKKASTMSQAALEKAQEELVLLQKTLEAKVEEANKKLAKAHNAAQEKFNGQARAAIASCVQKRNIDLLLDSAHDPVVHISDRAQQLLVTTYDITQEVIEILDK